MALVRTGGRRLGAVSTGELAVAAGASAAKPGPVAWSADGRYFATKLALTYAGSQPFRRGGAVAIVRDQPPNYPVWIVKSAYEISMLAWAPSGDRFAYSTSGFPAPHQLIIGFASRRAARILYSQIEHFDWVTWSPGGRWLLVDNPLRGAWSLFDTSGGMRPQSLERLGGAPLWCGATSRSLGQ